jgi:hypothetical protein
MATMKVSDFDPEYTPQDVDATGYVTAAAYQTRNTPPPIRAMINGEWWYVEPVDVATYTRFASGRWDIVLKDGRTGRTVAGNVPALVGA